MRISDSEVVESDPNTPRWSVQMRGKGNCDCGAGFIFAAEVLYLTGFRTKSPAITVALIDSLDQITNVCKVCGANKRIPNQDIREIVANFDIRKIYEIVKRLEEAPKPVRPEPFVD